jgi:hypothetical protein
MPPHAARDTIIRYIIINNLCLLTLSQQIWELILGTLIIYINKLNTLTLIYDTIIKNKKK